SALSASVTDAAGAGAGGTPTARTGPVSRSRSTWRVSPASRWRRLLRPWRLVGFSTESRRPRHAPAPPGRPSVDGLAILGAELPGGLQTGRAPQGRADARRLGQPAVDRLAGLESQAQRALTGG